MTAYPSALQRTGNAVCGSDMMSGAPWPGLHSILRNSLRHRILWQRRAAQGRCMKRWRKRLEKRVASGWEK